jgi:hypothetical protein
VTGWSCPTCSRTVTVDGNHLDEVVAIAAVTERHQRAHRAAEKVRGRPETGHQRPDSAGRMPVYPPNPAERP